MSIQEELEQRYGITVLSREKVRDVYRLKAKGHGHLCLKPYDYSEEEVRFIAGLLGHLAAAGYRHSPRVISDKQGNAYGIISGKRCILTDWVRGRHPFFCKREPFRGKTGRISQSKGVWGQDLAKGFRALARFHLYAQGLKTEGAPPNRIRYGSSQNVFHGYGEVLRKHPELTRYIPVCEEAVRLLAKPQAEQAVSLEQAAGAYTHGDYNYPNLVKDRKGRLHLIDFENASLNVRMFDLAHLLYRNCPWEPDMVLRGVAEYDRKRPLGREDRHLLYALLHAPYPIIRALGQYRREYARHVELPTEQRLNRYIRKLGALL
jgi:Ser/Thr protein kinase RdoA (MazF antagonist)